MPEKISPCPRCFAFLRHLAALTLVSARRLQITDMGLGAAAGSLPIVGLSWVFCFEKGSDHYFHGHVFMAKFWVLIVIGLLSIVPALESLSWNKPLRVGQVPTISARKLRPVTAVIHSEFLSTAIILLCAAIMARGGWV